jgi:hypothetical protein
VRFLYLLLYWLVGLGFLVWLETRRGDLTVGGFVGIASVAIMWPIVVFAVVMTQYEDKVLFRKRHTDY